MGLDFGVYDPAPRLVTRGLPQISMACMDPVLRTAAGMLSKLGIRPRSDGDLWLMSTPLGKRGFFYEAWARGGPDWHRIEGPVTENRRVREGKLEKERERMGADYFRQEYLCQFVNDQTPCFRKNFWKRRWMNLWNPWLLPESAPGLFCVGVDLGQRRDHSAIAVVEKVGSQRLVRSIVRVPLGTPYPEVIERVRRTVQHPGLWGRSCVVVDATGVGAPVVETMRRSQLGCSIWAVTITGGAQARGGKGLRWSVPKRDLMAGVQMLLERGELRIAKEMAGLTPLLTELRNMQVDVTRNGRTRMGAEGAGQHDDLVIALALACWRPGQGDVGERGFQL